MKFPFRDFWSRLIVKFGEFTYNSINWGISNNRGLRVENEDNSVSGPHISFTNFNQKSPFLKKCQGFSHILHNTHKIQILNL